MAKITVIKEDTKSINASDFDKKTKHLVIQGNNTSIEGNFNTQSDIMMHVPRGSKSEEYAKEHNIKFDNKQLYKVNKYGDVYYPDWEYYGAKVGVRFVLAYSAPHAEYHVYDHDATEYKYCCAELADPSADITIRRNVDIASDVEPKYSEAYLALAGHTDL